MKIKAEFGQGPLGLSLATTNVLAQINPGGQAHSAKLAVGDALCAVGDIDTTEKQHDEVLALIKAQPRPMVLTFSRQDEPAAKLFSAQPAESAAAAVSKAGSLMKGLFGASVQMIGALDRAVDKAVHDGQRQAKSVARQARITTATITRQKGLGSRARLAIGGDSGLSLDLRGLIPTDSSLSVPHPNDALMSASREWAQGRARQLGQVKQKNAELQARMVEVDSAVSQAKARALSVLADGNALPKALSTHMAAIVADAAATAEIAAELQTALVALESRMFSLLLTKASGDADAFEESEKKLMSQYAAARKKQLAAAQEDGTGKTARALLAAEEAQAAGAGGEAGAGGKLSAELVGYNSGQVAAIAAAINSSLKRNVDSSYASNRAALNAFVGGLGAAGERALASLSGSPPQAESSPSLPDTPTSIRVKDVARRYESSVTSEGSPSVVEGGTTNLRRELSMEDAAAAVTAADHTPNSATAQVLSAGAQASTANAGAAGSSAKPAAGGKKVGGRIAALAANYGKAGASVKKADASKTAAPAAGSSASTASDIVEAVSPADAGSDSVPSEAPVEVETAAAAPAAPAASESATSQPAAEGPSSAESEEEGGAAAAAPALVEAAEDGGKKSKKEKKEKKSKKAK